MMCLREEKLTFCQLKKYVTTYSPEISHEVLNAKYATQPSSYGFAIQILLLYSPFLISKLLQVSELGLELEERDGGIFVTDVQEHGCVAVHGMFTCACFPHCLSSSSFQSHSNVLTFSPHGLALFASFLC